MHPRAHDPPAHQLHRAHAPLSLCAALLTLSDSRTPETDDSGGLAESLLLSAGHTVVLRDLLPDDLEAAKLWLTRVRSRSDVDLVLLNGGTGISPRDRTVEAVQALLDRQIPGFGELFRWLSYRSIGAAAMASRALAGVMGRKLLFCMPGSPSAVRLAMESLILPEAGHLVGELQKDRPPGV
ncbi:MAG: molybdenum cofactor biosynthesis protein B [Acidobacteriota bacterium]